MYRGLALVGHQSLTPPRAARRGRRPVRHHQRRVRAGPDLPGSARVPPRRRAGPGELISIIVRVGNQYDDVVFFIITGQKHRAKLRRVLPRPRPATRRPRRHAKPRDTQTGVEERQRVERADTSTRHDRRRGRQGFRRA